MCIDSHLMACLIKISCFLTEMSIKCWLIVNTGVVQGLIKILTECSVSIDAWLWMLLLHLINLICNGTRDKWKFVYELIGHWNLLILWSLEMISQFHHDMKDCAVISSDGPVVVNFNCLWHRGPFIGDNASFVCWKWQIFSPVLIFNYIIPE